MEMKTETKKLPKLKQNRNGKNTVKNETETEKYFTT